MGEINMSQLQQAVAYADRWITYQQERKDIPGVAVAVRYGDDLLLSTAYGFANLERQEKMTARHIFRIASHSKTFTATAVMLLVETGKVRLDDTVGQHLPWVEGSLGHVTIRQLLNHASGVIRDGTEAEFWQLEGPFPDEDRLREMVGEGGAILPANDRFKYSNVGFSLLGQVVKAAIGVPYNEYVRSHIVDRLGLKDTGPETNPQVQERLVTGYTPLRPSIPRIPLADVETGAFSAATGFYSTAEDLCRYASAHFLGNEELLSDASKREMQHLAWSIDQSEEGYGLGFAGLTMGERRLVGHGGSFPGHATRTWLDPQDRLAVTVLTNESGGPANTLATGIFKIIDFALAKEKAEPDTDLDRYTGRFLSLFGVTDIARFGNALVSLSPDADVPVASVTELEVIDGDTLRIAETGGYGSPGETVRYERDVDGTIARVIMGGYSSYPPETFAERLRQKQQGHT